MKALQDLFLLAHLEVTPSLCRASLLPKMDSIIYKVHFPGAPITPGACLIQAVGEIIEQAFGKKVVLTQVKNVKFLSMIVPQEGKPIVFNIDMSWEEMKAKVVVSTDGSPCAKMSLVYKEA